MKYLNNQTASEAAWMVWLWVVKVSEYPLLHLPTDAPFLAW